jgi:hypothetical protein
MTSSGPNTGVGRYRMNHPKFQANNYTIICIPSFYSISRNSRPS